MAESKEAYFCQKDQRTCRSSLKRESRVFSPKRQVGQTSRPQARRASKGAQPPKVSRSRLRLTRSPAATIVRSKIAAERIQLLNAKAVTPGAYVAYWMQQSQ